MVPGIWRTGWPSVPRRGKGKRLSCLNWRFAEEHCGVGGKLARSTAHSPRRKQAKLSGPGRIASWAIEGSKGFDIRSCANRKAGMPRDSLAS